MTQIISLPISETATLRDKILAVFRAYNRPMTAKEVSNILGVTSSSVISAVHRAFKAGLLSQSGELPITTKVRAYTVSGYGLDYTYRL